MTAVGDPRRTAASNLALVSALAAAALAAALLAAGSPTAAVAGVVAVAGLAVAATRPMLGLLGLVAVGILESSLTEPFGSQLTPVKLAGLVCFGTFFLEALATGRRLRLDRSHAILGLLLAVALVSSLQARSPGDGMSTALRYASFAGLYFVATQFDDPRLARRVAWVTGASATVAAGLALRNFAQGETPLAAPLYGDPNDLAFLLVTALPLTLWLLAGATPTVRALVLGMVGVLATATVLSLSRGALVALGAGLVWHALTERRHLPALLLAATVAVAAALFATGSTETRVTSALEQKEYIAADNVETRLDAWRAATELAVEHPVLGVGPGNFGFYYFEKTGRPPGTFGLRVVHDAYLDVAAELGLTGLILFVLFLATVFARASAARARGWGPPGLAAATRTGLVIAMVGALTLSEQYFPPFWVLGALATLAWAQRGADEPEGR